MAGMKVLLAAFYGGTPDATHVEDFTTNLDIQLQQEECNEVIIAGDFNLRSLSWSNESLQATPLEYVPPAIITCTQTLIETCSFHGLAQLVPPLPSKGYTLDLIFASPGLANLVDLGESILQCDSHHAAQWVAMRGSPTGGSGACPSPHRNFYKCDYVRLNNIMSGIDWATLINSDDMDTCIDRFYGSLNSLISSHVPLTGMSPNDQYPKWFSRDLKTLLVSKKVAHTTWKRTCELSDYIKFKELRARCLRLSKCNYREHIARTEENIKCNPKAFWFYVNGLKSNNSVPSNMYYSNTKADDRPSVANLLSDYLTRFITTDLY